MAKVSREGRMGRVARRVSGPSLTPPHLFSDSETLRSARGGCWPLDCVLCSLLKGKCPQHGLPSCVRTLRSLTEGTRIVLALSPRVAWEGLPEDERRTIQASQRRILHSRPIKQERAFRCSPNSLVAVRH